MLSFFHAFGRVLPFALVLAVVPAAAQDYPSRPVTIVVGYTPGAAPAKVARPKSEHQKTPGGATQKVEKPTGGGLSIRSRTSTCAGSSASAAGLGFAADFFDGAGLVTSAAAGLDSASGARTGAACGAACWAGAFWVLAAMPYRRHFP